MIKSIETISVSKDVEKALSKLVLNIVEPVSLGSKSEFDELFKYINDLSHSFHTIKPYEGYAERNTVFLRSKSFFYWGYCSVTFRKNNALTSINIKYRGSIVLSLLYFVLFTYFLYYFLSGYFSKSLHFQFWHFIGLIICLSLPFYGRWTQQNVIRYLKQLLND